MGASPRSLGFRELQDLRVLVVEDNHTNQLIFSKLLDNWGMKATLAGSGPEALSILNAEPSFALILLDYQMRVWTGSNWPSRLGATLDSLPPRSSC